MNPHKTDKFKETFTLEQAQLVMNNLNSVRTLKSAIKSEITFGSNKCVEEQLLVAGYIPSFILRNSHERMEEGVLLEYGFPMRPTKGGFLLDDQGKYLYDSYDEDSAYEHYDSPLEPMLLVIDHERNEFMFQYPYGICVFGNTTGPLTFVRMD